MPSRNLPLTDSFPNIRPAVPTPPGHHPASPRFLLSLLSTAIYLSIPTLASQALQLILGSVSPRTVIPYLNFAIGKGIPAKQADELEAAVGLEHVCDVTTKDGSTPPPFHKALTFKSGPSQDSSVQRDEDALSPKIESLHLVQKDGSRHANEPDHLDSDSDEEDEDECGACFSYGPVSDKIGEAAACWLTRWGVDMLPYEEDIVERDENAARSQAEPGGTSILDIPVIWRRGGLTAKWARAVISSDAFFAPSERDRYNFACRVAEMRRQEGIDKAEEREWQELFSHGIYYMHMVKLPLTLLSLPLLMLEQVT
jgi:hypothetical protein